MANCPTCKEEIDHLIAKRTRITGFKVEDGKPVYDETLLNSFYYAHDEREGYWYCPTCGDNLFGEEVKAIEFLDGG